MFDKAMPQGRADRLQLYSYSYGLPYRLKPIIMAHFIIVCPNISLQRPGEASHIHPQGD
jgi:hypothetical protein